MGIKSNEAVTDGPVVYWFLQDGLLREHDYLYVVLDLQPLQDVLHRTCHGLQGGEGGGRDVSG